MCISTVEAKIISSPYEIRQNFWFLDPTPATGTAVPQTASLSKRGFSYFGRSEICWQFYQDTEIQEKLKTLILKTIKMQPISHDKSGKHQSSSQCKFTSTQASGILPDRHWAYQTVFTLRPENVRFHVCCQVVPFIQFTAFLCFE